MFYDLLVHVDLPQVFQLLAYQFEVIQEFLFSCFIF